MTPVLRASSRPPSAALVLVALASAGLMFGGCKRKEQDHQGATPTPRQGEHTASEHQGASGKDSMFFPSGQKEGSSIRVDKDLPPEIWVGREFTETITVTNISPKDIHNVRMTERLSPNFKPGSGNEGEIREGQASWDVGSLRPGESKSFKLTGVAREPGEIRHCLRVHFEPELCTSRTAAVAALELSMKGPKEVLICESIDYVITVRNTGTARLDAVKVEGALPEGLLVEEGKKSAMSVDAGSLGPGESRDLPVRVKPSRRGEFTTKASADAKGARSEASWQTVVRQPVLEMTATATDSVFAGSPAKAEFTVTNTGDGPSPDTVIELAVPQSMKVTEASSEGRISGTSVAWKIGSLHAGQSKKLNVTYTGTAAGAAELAARASGPCVQAVQASAKTEFRGVPAVLLEVVDDPDPVAVGSNVTYTITVVNQGDATLTNIKVECALEESMTAAGSDGPTRGDARERAITFGPLDRLEPKGRAVWKVTAKATKAADARFKVRMTSDQIERPVEETESTHSVVQTR